MTTAYNHLPTPLRNHYIIARHGFSLANNAKLICSNPSIAIPETGGPLNTGYGLHERGREQVEASAKLLADHLGENKDKVKVFCSPFVRTRQTAEIFSKGLGIVEEPTPAMSLRERFYGEFDMTSDENYKVCWQDDATGPDHGEHSRYGIESPSSVADRTTRFIVDEIEAKMEGATVLLVAHGDVCQIMQTAFLHTDAWRHRELEHVDTANWRDMQASS
ncbi:putative 2,3-bisphosphoglycerate-dependent phosphoglycerate mutase [Fennellomyces sp. T-0311]|nr:putative 2,3-bisphosphoglycerate-dependent phosphoglycerate mutase [Fennellomyces sp. T-0311]